MEYSIDGLLEESKALALVVLESIKVFPDQVFFKKIQPAYSIM